MHNNDFLKLVEMLKKELAARVSENLSFQQTILDIESSHQQTIRELNETIPGPHATIGVLLEENRLLKCVKKNSCNSSIPLSKDENRPLKKTNSLRNRSGKKPGYQKGHNRSTLLMSACPDVIEDHEPQFCNCCGLGLDTVQSELLNRRQVIDIPVVNPIYTEHRISAKSYSCGHTTRANFPIGVNAHAQIAYLHTPQYMPVVRISEHFAVLYI